MPYKEPGNYSLITYIWMLLIACWGGAANYISRIKSGNEPSFRFLTLLGELCISGFSGLLTFYLCVHYQIEPLITAVFVGVSGHAGGKTVQVLENVLNRQLQGINIKFGSGNDISSTQPAIKKEEDKP